MEHIEKQQLESSIAELDIQIQRMADYIDKHSDSTSGSMVNTLKATVRHRNSLVTELGLK